MIWEKKHIALGNLKPQKKVSMVFKALETLNNIKYMTSSCGCSKPTQVDNTIVVTFTPGSIPVHLSFQGRYLTRKEITIFYEDGTRDVLSFSATVKK